MKLFILAVMLHFPVDVLFGELVETIYRVEPNRSSISFVLKATGHEVIGKTQFVKGEFVVPVRFQQKGSPIKAVIDINAASLDTGNKMRDKKMRTETFSVDQYPWVRFEIESMEGDLRRLGQGNAVSMILKGNLTIRKVTRKVSIQSEVTLKNRELHVAGKHKLNWKEDYNVPDPSILFLRVDKSVMIHFDIVAKIKE